MIQDDAHDGRIGSLETRLALLEQRAQAIEDSIAQLADTLDVSLDRVPAAER